jgi:hypothetical protein
MEWDEGINVDQIDNRSRSGIALLVESKALDAAVGMIEDRLIQRWVITTASNTELLEKIKRKQEVLRELESEVRRLYKTIGSDYVR